MDLATLRERWNSLGKKRQAATVVMVGVIIIAAIWLLTRGAMT